MKEDKKTLEKELKEAKKMLELEIGEKIAIGMNDGVTYSGTFLGWGDKGLILKKVYTDKGVSYKDYIELDYRNICFRSKEESR